MINTLDIIFTVLVLVISFSIFINLINDYRVLNTITKLFRKSIRISRSRTLTITIPSLALIHGLKILNITVNQRNVKARIVQDHTIELSNVEPNQDLKIVIEFSVTGRIGDYNVKRCITLSPE